MGGGEYDSGEESPGVCGLGKGKGLHRGIEGYQIEVRADFEVEVVRVNVDSTFRVFRVLKISWVKHLVGSQVCLIKCAISWARTLCERPSEGCFDRAYGRVVSFNTAPMIP